MEGFDPAINYGPNDAGISAVTIILGIVSLIVISWLFGKIYAQVANFFENNNKNNWLRERYLIGLYVSNKKSKRNIPEMN